MSSSQERREADGVEAKAGRGRGNSGEDGERGPSEDGRDRKGRHHRRWERLLFYLHDMRVYNVDENYNQTDCQCKNMLLFFAILRQCTFHFKSSQFEHNSICQPIMVSADNDSAISTGLERSQSARVILFLLGDQIFVIYSCMLVFTIFTSENIL